MHNWIGYFTIGMKTNIYREALDAFCNPLHEFSVEPMNGGLINQSYKVTSKYSGESFLLQKINEFVFNDPIAVQSNYDKVWKHLQNEETGYVIPEPKQFPGNTTLFFDSQNKYWRVFEFIYRGQSFATPQNSMQAKAVANTFGQFTSCFNEFDIEELNITIPEFHNLSSRYQQFEHSIQNHRFERIKKASPLIDEFRKRERYANLYDVFTESDEFPKRVMHHDAKISNVLFDEDSGNVICPVDFDTCMPGYFFSDLGDMIRSMAASSDENDKGVETLHIRKDYYQAILEGYLEEMNGMLTDSELKYIHHAGLLMIYMQALRFITDYLNGDPYYKTTYEEQNFDRAKNQLTLLQRLEEFLTSNYQLKT